MPENASRMPLPMSHESQSSRATLVQPGTHTYACVLTPVHRASGGCGTTRMTRIYGGFVLHLASRAAMVCVPTLQSTSFATAPSRARSAAADGCGLQSMVDARLGRGRLSSKLDSLRTPKSDCRP